MTSSENRFDDAIAAFPPSVQADLREILATGAFIPSERVAQLSDAMDVDVATLMMALLPVAAAYARPPISEFYVGAVALGMPPTDNAGPGSLYLGANMEFPGQALAFSVHGEQSAVNNAWLHGEHGLQALAINAAPCGYCRQFLYELSTAASLRIHLPDVDGGEDAPHETRPLKYFLPEAFGPRDLGFEGGLMAPESHGLTISEGGAAARAALGGANACYAPYSEGYCGVALTTADETLYAGRYAENAAYNPSLAPMLSALAWMNMSLPAQAPLEIARAVLVEASAEISQRDASAAVLASVAPSIALEVVPAE